MKHLAVIVLLALASLCHAQEPPKPVTPPKAVPKFKSLAPSTPIKAGEHIVIDATSASGEVFFFYDEVAFPKSRATQIGKTLILSTSVNGTYIVNVASLDDKAKERVVVTVTGGTPTPGPPPEPPPPTDPLEALKFEVQKGFAKTDANFAKLDARITALEGSKPPPAPPIPPPSPSPIPFDGFRVMIIEDKEKLSLMPAAQLSIRTSPIFRDYLDANCVLEIDSKTKAYRIWDHKTNAAGEYKYWQDAVVRPRAHSYTDASGKAVHVANFLPWIIVSNHPHGGYEGPLPANVEETIKLLKKIKGN